MKIKAIILSISLLFTLQSCDRIIDDVVDCVFNKRPDLPNLNFPNATIDTAYEFSFDGEVQNEPLDNNYYYYYGITGNLPPGVNVSFIGRRAIFEGTPTETGTYEFRILLEVEHENYQINQELCERTTSKKYTLTVN